MFCWCGGFVFSVIVPGFLVCSCVFVIIVAFYVACLWGDAVVGGFPVGFCCCCVVSSLVLC